MMKTITNTASTYFEFYVDLFTSTWDNITFWQYIGLSVTLFTIGSIWMTRGADGRV